jgi:hypothetical protein
VRSSKVRRVAPTRAGGRELEKRYGRDLGKTLKFSNRKAREHSSCEAAYLCLRRSTIAFLPVV